MTSARKDRPTLALPNSAETKLQTALAESDRDLAERDAAAESAAKQLNKTERSALARCEKVIDKGRKAFVEIGKALQQIRDKRLYRETHERFEDYCRDRWEFSKANANRVIAAAAVVDRVTPIGVTPANEAQARPLTTIDVEKVRDAWQDVLDRVPKDEDGNPKITALAVQEVVDLWRADDEPYRDEGLAEFKLDRQRESVLTWGRKQIDRWPLDHRKALVQVFRQLAKEAAE